MINGDKMKNIRLIARLDVKGPNLVKGIQLEGLRKIGNPNEYAKKYYEQGIDEIIYIDIVASLYNRNNLSDIVTQCTQDVFVPITVGGGIRNIEDVDKILHCGADKIAINTAAIKRPELIKEVADKYGSQCMVLSIQAKKIAEGKWEAGEILLTSVDNEGTKKGFDIDLVKAVSDIVPIPVIACGGMGKPEDYVDVVKSGHADAVAAASVLHYNEYSIKEIKQAASVAGINIREV